MRAARFIPRRRLRLLATTFVIAALAGMGAFALLERTQIGRELEHRSVDMRFQQRGPLPVSKDIVVLGIDNKTDQALGTRFPYPRSYHARAVERLTQAGAAAIVFDVQFLEPTEARDDTEFIRAMAASGKVVLATAPEGSVGASEQAARREQSTPLPFRSLRTADGRSALEASGALVGNARQIYSGDDVRRWIEPLEGVPVGGGTKRLMPSLSLAAIAMAEGNEPYEYDGMPKRLPINYRGATTTLAPGGYAMRNYADVVGEQPGNLAWAEGKIVLVGATSAVLQDLHETPFSVKRPGEEPTRLMPGVEIHAHAIDTLRKGDWLVDQSPRSAALMAAALVAITWLLLALTNIWIGLVLALAANGAFLWLAQRAFEREQVWQLVPTLAAGLAALAVTLVVLASTAIRERRHVTSLFSRYVSPDVVRELVDIHEQIIVGGERREISVLFSDIRGFTTMSEGLDPAELVQQLNDYFEEMVETVELERGTFDKFIGDGLMAIFGAPLMQDDHAERACAAALEMADRLDALNAERRVRGLPVLQIGIGIHTGEAIVGNIGSPSRRVDYTAIGDTVNLASRLEASTKTVGARILVSKETADAASVHTFVPRGSIVVKGRSQSTEVFELTKPAGRAHRTDGEPEPGQARGSDATAGGQAA
jgi:adenylate cyclase